MNKKSKIIIVVSIIFIVATLVGVLCWGLQPIQKDEVSLEKLNKKLGTRYCIPSELPFEGDIKCYIIYIEGHMGIVLTRFEASSKRSTGYLIELKDYDREIYVESNNSITISSEEIEGLLIENYNDQKIQYLLIDTETANKFVALFEINGKTYYIRATYNKDIDIEILRSDIKCLLDQMIRQ
jgi:ABC-type antimicrobial peptide transport system permease subunit